MISPRSRLSQYRRLMAEYRPSASPEQQAKVPAEPLHGRPLRRRQVRQRAVPIPEDRPDHGRLPLPPRGFSLILPRLRKRPALPKVSE